MYSGNRRIDFLSIALEAYWRRGTALSVTLPLCDRIRQGFVNSAYIWGSYYKHKSSLFEIDQCLEFQQHWKKQVADGIVTMDYEAKLEVGSNDLFSFVQLISIHP